LNNFVKRGAYFFQETIWEISKTFIFQHHFLCDFWYLSCPPKNLHKSRFKRLAFHSPNHPTISYCLKHFLFSIAYQLGSPSFNNYWSSSLFLWFKAYKLDGDTFLPLFPWWGTHVTYDAIKDAFVFIIKNVEFHVSHEQTHILLSSSLQFLYQYVDIVFIIDAYAFLWLMFPLLIWPKQKKS
jgi:hypothetical protein